MTFYWWSHWFWITLLGNILLPIVIVHAYPSQDIAAEYNNNNNNNNRDPKSTTTRLYQTTTTIIWATTTPPNPSAVGAKIIPPTAEDTAAVDDEVDDEDEVMEELESESEEALEDGVAGGEGDRNESEEFEYKRSADIVNNANGTREQIEATIAHESPNRGSRSQDDDDDEEEKEKARNSTRQEKELHDPSVHSNYSNFSSHLASTNETRVIATSIQGSTSGGSSKSQPAEFLGHSTVEWVGSVVQAGPDASADDQADAPAAGQKAPFTLENVNKEEEIVRAENEHRSRKSKVLSAEYKHTDRFINYSTDSKNLLARSASTAPNEFDGDEGNISSEALAIQRTYFLDASAISAICFTVFGICCTVGTIGIVLYRRRYLNKPQALSEPDSSVYIDDSTMRDNSDEMYSLDNDSFLNSLEAMTIQNYWTDTVKHTKL